MGKRRAGVGEGVGEELGKGSEKKKKTFGKPHKCSVDFRSDMPFGDDYKWGSSSIMRTVCEETDLIHLARTTPTIQLS